MTVSYGGIGLTPPAHALEAVGRWWHAHRVREFDRPAHFSGGSLHLPIPYPPTREPPRVGVLTWPADASRWATCHLLATGGQLAAVQAAAGPPLPLVVSDGTTTVTAPMYRLPARPVEQRGGGADLYLLTLVDERYYWWAAGDQPAPSAPASWSALLTALFSSLGVTPTISSIPSAYGTPSSRWAVGYQPLPLLIDAACRTVGLRVVRSLAGVVACVNYATAAASDQGQWASYQYQCLAGGRIAASEIGQSVPAKCGVVFLGSGNTASSVTDVTLSGLALPQYGSAAGVSGRVGQVVADLAAGSAGIDTYATQAATDYYLWQLSQTDATLRGVQGWSPTGLEDAVEWSQGLDAVVTRVVARPVADANTYGSLPPSAGGTATTTTVYQQYLLSQQEDGEDAPVVPGPPGAAGAAGASGRNGANGLTIPPLEPDAEDTLLIPGPQGVPGPTGGTGPAGPPGPTIPPSEPDVEDTLLIPGPAGKTGGTGPTGPAGPPGQIVPPYEPDTEDVPFVPGLPTPQPNQYTTNITAAGTTQSTATQLATQYNVVTTVPSGSGVVLTAPTYGGGGYSIVVSNAGANTLLVYPPTGQSFYGQAVNTPYSLAVSAAPEDFTLVNGVWYPNSLVVSVGPSPGAPTLTATAGNAQVALSWTAGLNSQLTYIYRGTSSAVTNTNGTLVYSGSGTSYTDTGVTNGTTYYYIAYGQNNGVFGTGSSVQNATPYATRYSVDMSAQGLGGTSIYAVSSVYGPTGAAARSVSLWVKWAGVYGSGSGGLQFVFEYGSGGANSTWGCCEYNGGFTFTNNGGSNSGGSPSSGTWYHLVFAYSGSTLTIYVNGSAVSSASYTLNTGNAYPAIGAAGGNVSIDGKVTDVRFANICYTSAQVATLYNGGVPQWGTINSFETGNLWGYWSCQDGSGSSLSDASGNSRNMTLTGSYAWSTDVP